LGFNKFLPEGYEIPITDDYKVPQNNTLKVEEGGSFVNNIRVDISCVHQPSPSTTEPVSSPISLSVEMELAPLFSLSINSS